MSRGPAPEIGENRHRNIGRLLLRAFRRFDAELNARLHARGYRDVRLAHSAVFAHLDADGTHLTDLAQRAGMTKQSMGELVADLEQKGYVERQDDPADRRAKIVALTEFGRKHVRDAVQAIEEIEAGYARRLGAERMGQLRSLLEVLTVVEDDQPPPGSSGAAAPDLEEAQPLPPAPASGPAGPGGGSGRRGAPRS